jgi:hypothetical protein
LSDKNETVCRRETKEEDAIPIPFATKSKMEITAGQEATIGH